MSWLSATAPPRGGPPATLEASVSFRVKTAPSPAPAAPTMQDASLVMITQPNGGGVVYPPSEKLVILAERARKH